MSQTNTLAAGTRQNQRPLEDLLPDAFSVEERDTGQWLAYLHRFAHWLTFHTPDGPQGNWQALLNEPEGLEQWVRWLAKEPGISDAVKERTASADRALLLTFLKLLYHPQDQFRRLTEKHLSYYYRQVLGFSELPALGDEAHLVLTLESDAPVQTLPAGTLFNAGSDADGQLRFYRLADTTGINHARVTSLRTLGLDTEANDTGFLRTELVNEEQGLLFPKGGALTFGEFSEYEEDPEQRQSRPAMGLLLTSPLLWLAEGVRTITLTFHRSPNTGGNFPDPMDDLFDIAVSTTEGSVNLRPDQITVDNQGDQVTFILTLDALFPSLEQAPEPVSAKVTAPFVQLTLKADSDTRRFPRYQLLKQVALQKVDLSVAVSGLKQVLIRNDLAPLDPGGPMELFGAQPRVGSNFQFSHPELAIKPLTSLTVGIDWANKPDSIATYYHAYRKYLKDNQEPGADNWPEHKVSVGSPWSGDGLTLTDLFANDSTSTIQRDYRSDSDNNTASDVYPEGLAWTLYRQLPLPSPEPREWPFWYQVTLSNSDFGHTLYNNVLSWAAAENSRNLVRYQKGLPSTEAAAQYHDSLKAYAARKEAYDTYQTELSEWQAVRTLHWFRLVSAERAQTDRVAGLYDSKGINLNGGGAYTFYLSTYNPGTDLWSHYRYNFTDSGTRAARLMADRLEAIPNGQPVLIFSGTESDHQDDRHLTALVTAVEQCGGSRAQFVDSIGSEHGAYQLIGRKGLGANHASAYEYSAGRHNALAYVDTIIVRHSSGSYFYSPNTSRELYARHQSPKPAAVADPGTGPAAPEPSYTPLVVNQPLVPLADQLSINYTASTELTVTNAQGDDDRLLMHLHPVGTQVVASSEKLGVSSEQAFIPSLDKSGYLYIGLGNTPDSGTLSLLFDVAAVDSPEGLSGATVRWDYLTEAGWTKFSTDRQQEGNLRAMVLADGTNGLINTGIIRFQLINDMRRQGAFAGDQQLWLRGSLEGVTGNVKSIWSRLKGIYTQAASVVFSADDHITGQAQTPRHLPEPLPAATITALNGNNPAIASVTQPLPSFGGRAPEASVYFNNRVSERLRHRGRAITGWDYERLVLQQFPQLFMARCVRGEVQGEVVMQVIPNTTDPALLKPRAPLFLQNNIRDFLQPLMPPQAQLKVSSPRFQEVRFGVSINIREGYDQGITIQALNDELVTHLSPWTNSDSVEIRNSISLTSIARFVASRPYISRVLKISAERQEWDDTDKALVFRPVAETVIRPDDKLGNPQEVILVPARLHTINVLPAGVVIFEGVGRMEVELDFEVAD